MSGSPPASKAHQQDPDSGSLFPASPALRGHSLDHPWPDATPEPSRATSPGRKTMLLNPKTLLSIVWTSTVGVVLCAGCGKQPDSAAPDGPDQPRRPEAGDDEPMAARRAAHVNARCGSASGWLHSLRRRCRAAAGVPDHLLRWRRGDPPWVLFHRSPSRRSPAAGGLTPRASRDRFLAIARAPRWRWRARRMAPSSRTSR